MGQPDFYPFVLSHEVVAKLHFIHLVVSAVGASADEAAQEPQAGAADVADELMQEQEQWQGQGVEQMQGQNWT